MCRCGILLKLLLLKEPVSFIFLDFFMHHLLDFIPLDFLISINQVSIRLDKFGVLGLEIAGLVLCPNQAGVFGNGCLRVKAVDIAGLGNDTGGVSTSSSINAHSL